MRAIAVGPLARRMPPGTIRRGVAVAAALCSLALLAPVLASPRPATAATAAERPFPVVSVSGEGSVTVVPDLAIATAGVTTEAKTPREATAANARAMGAVIDAARQAGLAETDIRTSRFGITAIYSPRTNAGSKPQLVGYRCSNQAAIKIRDLTKAGEVLDLLVGAGANDVAGLAFVVSEPGKVVDEARLAAMVDAKHKATLYAEAAGAQLGRAISIAEQGGGYHPPAPAYRAAAEAAAPVTPISPGEQSIQMQVSVTYELLH